MCMLKNTHFSIPRIIRKIYYKINAHTEDPITETSPSIFPPLPSFLALPPSLQSMQFWLFLNLAASSCPSLLSTARKCMGHLALISPHVLRVSQSCLILGMTGWMRYSDFGPILWEYLFLRLHYKNPWQPVNLLEMFWFFMSPSQFLSHPLLVPITPRPTDIHPSA